MTLPVAVGFPDWGRFVGQQQKIYLDDQVTATTTLQSTARFYVGDIPYLLLVTNSVANRATVRLTYFYVETGGSIVASQTVTLGQGAFFRQAYPTLAPFVQIQYQDNNNGTLVNLQLSSLWSPARRMSSSPASDIVLSTNHSLASGGQVTDNVQDPYPGEAAFSFWVSDGRARCIIKSVDVGGATTDIYHLTSPTANQSINGQLFLLATPLQFVFNNQAGAANTLRFTLVARPIAPGM